MWFYVWEQFYLESNKLASNSSCSHGADHTSCWILWYCACSAGVYFAWRQLSQLNIGTNMLLMCICLLWYCSQAVVVWYFNQKQNYILSVSCLLGKGSAGGGLETWWFSIHLCLDIVWEDQKWSEFLCLVFLYRKEFPHIPYPWMMSHLSPKPKWNLTSPLSQDGHEPHISHEVMGCFP